MRALGASRTSVVPGGALAGGWARNPLWKTARAVPSLDLRFAENKTLGDAYAGGSPVTFTRASSGTFVGSDGLIKSATTNEPRFDHNPTTGESLGLLVEEARTNLCLQSENLGTTWTLSGATLSLNATVAPDGQTTADTLIPNNGATGVARQDILLTDSTTYTFSVFLKTAGLNSVNLQFYNKANTFHGSKNLDLSTGILSGSETIGVSSVIAYGNGWYRLTVTNLGSGTGATTPNVRIVSVTTGNGTFGILAWGAQLEAGAFPTSYIPTTTATVTRAADVASITGSNFSSWYNQTEGTVFIHYSGQSGGRVFMSDDGTTNNRFEVRISANTSQLSSWSGGTQDVPGLFAPAATGLVDGVSVKTAVGLKVNDAAISTNGAAVGTDTSCAMPVALNRMILGSFQGSATFLNGPIRRLTFWPTRLSNTTIQQISQP